MDNYNLQRFIDAQEGRYKNALQEIKIGYKSSHWMWYVFPQIKGLGRSSTSIFYSIGSLDEAEEYLNNSILSERLIEISNALISLDKEDAKEIFGSTDAMKLKSSMTLFSLCSNTDPVFSRVLKKYYGGKKSWRTVKLTE